MEEIKQSIREAEWKRERGRGKMAEKDKIKALGDTVCCWIFSCSDCPIDLNQKQKNGCHLVLGKKIIAMVKEIINEVENESV